jgi:hypothetical protein
MPPSWLEWIPGERGERERGTCWRSAVAVAVAAGAAESCHGQHLDSWLLSVLKTKTWLSCWSECGISGFASAAAGVGDVVIVSVVLPCLPLRLPHCCCCHWIGSEWRAQEWIDLTAAAAVTEPVAEAEEDGKLNDEMLRRRERLVWMLCGDENSFQLKQHPQCQCQG